jgi:hypothetical protein
MDRDQWRALVNTVMDFWFHKILGNFLVAERLAAFQGLSSMELVSYKKSETTTGSLAYSMEEGEE